MALLRVTEMSQVMYDQHGVVTEIWTSIKSDAVTEANISVGMMCFLIALLGVGAAMFSKDSNELVIIPIERMISFVRALAQNPLAQIRCVLIHLGFGHAF